MSEQFNVTINLTTRVCCTCGVVYAMPCKLLDRLRENNETFHCPNGHSNYFPSESNEEGLEEENEALAEEITKLTTSLKYYKNKANKVKK